MGGTRDTGLVTVDNLFENPARYIYISSQIYIFFFFFFFVCVCVCVQCLNSLEILNVSPEMFRKSLRVRFIVLRQLGIQSGVFLLFSEFLFSAI